jgi:hypothetical protein
MTSEERMALVKKNPISIGCAALSLLLAAGIYLRMDEIPDAEAVLAEKSKLSERYTLNITNAAQLKEQFDDITEANKAIDARIVRANQFARNTQYFYKLAADSGVKVVDFQQAALATPTGPAAKQASTFTPVGFRVSVQGSITQVLEFLRMLEAGTHYSRVLTATVSGSAANRTAPLTLALSLDLLGLP